MKYSKEASLQEKTLINKFIITLRNFVNEKMNKTKENRRPLNEDVIGRNRAMN